MPFTEGNHNVRITAHALGKTGTGIAQIAVEFEREAADDNGNIVKENITWYGYFTENARQITIDALIAMGWDAQADNYDITKLHMTDRLVGNDCRITCKNEADQNGDMRIKVAWVNKGGVAVKELLPQGEIAQLAEDIKGDLVKAFQGLPTGGDKPKESSIEDEDIPF